MVVRIYFWDNITSYWLILTSTYQYLDSYDIKRDSRDFKFKKHRLRHFALHQEKSKYFQKRFVTFLMMNLTISQARFINIHPSIHPSIYPCIHTYIHTYIHTHIHRISSNKRRASNKSRSFKRLRLINTSKCGAQ